MVKNSPTSYDFLYSQGSITRFFDSDPVVITCDCEGAFWAKKKLWNIFVKLLSPLQANVSKWSEKYTASILLPNAVTNLWQHFILESGFKLPGKRRTKNKASKNEGIKIWNCVKCLEYCGAWAWLKFVQILYVYSKLKCQTLHIPSGKHLLHVSVSYYHEMQILIQLE